MNTYPHIKILYLIDCIVSDICIFSPGTERDFLNGIFLRIIR